MADPIEKTKQTVSAAAHPVDTGKELADEASRGRSARTPVLALTGVTLVIAAAVAILLVIAFLAYYLA